MRRTLNKIMLIGRVTEAAKPSSTGHVDFFLETKARDRRSSRIHIHSITCSRAHVRTVARGLLEGDVVYVEGSVEYSYRHDSYPKEPIAKIIALEIFPLG